MEKNMYDLEEDILACWQVVDDIDLLFEYIMDDEDCADIPAAHFDRLSNILLGMKELYNLKFNKCFDTHSKIVSAGKK